MAIAVEPGAQVAPTRSDAQRRAALARANDVRTRRSRFKAQLRAGDATVSSVLEDPPGWLGTAKVDDLLLAVPKLGRVKSQRLLAQARISPVKTLVGLTERQRAELLALLDGR
jgi:hypothetical protein